MPRQNAIWQLSALLSAVLVAAASWGLSRLSDRTRDRSLQRHREQIAALPERSAAKLVAGLASDESWLEVTVAACTDPRPAVARAALEGLLQLVDRWSQLPPGEAAPRAGRLGRLLAEHAPQMKASQLESAQTIAEQLLNWPLDSRRTAVAQLIADCDLVLRLPTPAPEEPRLAAIPNATGIADD